jgi:sec-independent protein translocase protein TatA
MEWILILLVLILLFGAKKLPDTAKALGQSLRMFKKETSKMSEEDEARQTVQAQAEPVAPQTAQIPPSTPSIEERLRLLEEENRKLRESQQPVSSQNEQRSN